MSKTLFLQIFLISRLIAVYENTARAPATTPPCRLFEPIISAGWRDGQDKHDPVARAEKIKNLTVLCKEQCSAKRRALLANEPSANSDTYEQCNKICDAQDEEMRRELLGERVQKGDDASMKDESYKQTQTNLIKRYFGECGMATFVTMCAALHPINQNGEIRCDPSSRLFK